MSTDQTLLSINATYGREASKRETGLENKVKASMRAVIANNWMAASDDVCFRAGVGGALLDVGSDSEDGKKLLRGLDTLRRFSAFLRAAEAGLNVSVDEDDMLGKQGDPPLPLMGWWHEVNAKKAADK